MKKLLIAASVAALSLGFIPSHADPTNGCYADDGSGAPGVQNTALTCEYTAGTAQGQIVQATPNQVHVVDLTANDGQELYSQDTLTPPGTSKFSTPVGHRIRLTVGPDDGVIVQGSIGAIYVGDAS